MWHSHTAFRDRSNPEFVRLIGVYSSEDEAVARVAAAKLLPGFGESSESFDYVDEPSVSVYVVDELLWRDGFISIESSGDNS